MFSCKLTCVVFGSNLSNLKMFSDTESYSDDEGSYLYEGDVDSIPSTSEQSIASLPAISCSVCGAKFNRKDNLDRHIRQVHKKEPELVKGEFKCTQCKKLFKQKQTLNRHVKKIHGKNLVEEQREKKKTRLDKYNYIQWFNGGKYRCPRCEVLFTSKNNRDQHYFAHFKKENNKCLFCSKAFKYKYNKVKHEKDCSSKPEKDEIINMQVGGSADDEKEISDGHFIQHQQAFGGKIKVDRLTFHKSMENLMDRLNEAYQKAADHIELYKEENWLRSKVYLSLHANFYQINDADVITYPTPCFNTEPRELIPGDDVASVMDGFQAHIQQKIDNYERNGSGWVLHDLVYMDLNMAQLGSR